MWLIDVCVRLWNSLLLEFRAAVRPEEAMSKCPLLSVFTASPLISGHTCACRAAPHADTDASDNLRKVIVSSFVLHASCLKTVSEGSDAQNVDDLYSISLQRQRGYAATDGAEHAFFPKGRGQG